MLTCFLFSDSYIKVVGGMEVHQENFLSYFSDALLVVKGISITIYNRETVLIQFDNVDELIKWIKESYGSKIIFFFNNLSWLMDLPFFYREVPQAKIVMRSGGNDIYKALAKVRDKDLNEKLNITTDIINNYIDKLIINSDYSYFRNLEVGILPEKMIKIRGGVDMRAVADNIKRRESERHKFDILHGTENKKLMIIASRFVPFKGITEFIDQLAKYGHLTEWHLLLIGSGRMKDDILLSLKQFPEENYTYLGEKSNTETIRYISISDIFINFSLEYKEFVDNSSFIHTETMGRGMIEAISQNIPVLAFNSGGTAELFDENTAVGFLVSEINKTTIFLDAFFKNRYVVQCDTDYSWDSVFEKYKRLFSSLLYADSAISIIAFDYDGTIRNDETDIDSLCNYMKRRKRNKLYICLTARSKEEASEIYEQLPVDYLVSENGAVISSADSSVLRWNLLAEHEMLKKQTEYIFEKISVFTECKITHPFTIHMVRPIEIADLLVKLRAVIGKMPYQIIYSERFIKIQHVMFNKLGALEYLMKDYCFSCSVGAGDSLNDAAFIKKCHIGFVHRKLAETLPGELANINIFERDEIGMRVFKRMLNVAERREGNIYGF